MFKNVYYGKVCSQEKKKAEFIVESLYTYFINHPEEIPLKYYNSINGESLERSTTDFIASCTDSYAINSFMTNLYLNNKYLGLQGKYFQLYFELKKELTVLTSNEIYHMYM